MSVLCLQCDFNGIPKKRWGIPYDDEEEKCSILILFYHYFIGYSLYSWKWWNQFQNECVCSTHCVQCTLVISSVSNFSPSFHVRWLLCVCMHIMCTKVEISFPFSIWIISIFHCIHFSLIPISSLFFLLPSIYRISKLFTFQFHLFSPYAFSMKNQSIFTSLYMLQKHAKGGNIYFICKSLSYNTNAYIYTSIQYTQYILYRCIEHVAEKKHFFLSLILNTWCEPVSSLNDQSESEQSSSIKVTRSST